MSNIPTHGSDVQEAPDWWKASDGRFYPPELHPDYVKPAVEAPAAPAATAPAASAPDASLADRLRAEADRVGDEASAAADAGVGSMGSAGDIAGSTKSAIEGTAGGAGSVVTGAAAAATGAVAGAVGGVADTAADTAAGAVTGAAGAVTGAAGAVDDVADAASDAVPDGMPLSADSLDPRATIPMNSPMMGAATIIQQPGSQLSPGAPPSLPSSMPSPGAPPSMPPVMPTPSAPPSSPPGMPPAPTGMPPAPTGMPPAPGARPGMPPAPGSPPSPTVEQGPGGITYTAAPSPVHAAMDASALPESVPGGASNFQTPMATATPSVSTAKASSGTSGLMALVAGAGAIAGSLLQWGKGAVTGIDGVEKAIIEVPGFDSSGLITAVAGGVLILAGILFFMGVAQQSYWAALSFIAGAVIVGAVVFSMIDIGDLSTRYASQWQAEGLAQAGDVISTNGAIGLWITGAAGVLGVLAAPFVKRS